jgi:hypothetical protein
VSVTILQATPRPRLRTVTSATAPSDTTPPDTTPPDTSPSDTVLDLLLPAAERLGPDPAERRLTALYDAGPGRHVRANMISTVDGGAWGPDHRSGSINDAADWRVFQVLRATADVVLVGAGTARAEGYRALRRPRGLAPDAAPLELALVTRSGLLPDALAAAHPIVLTTRAGARVAGSSLPAERIVVVESGSGTSSHARPIVIVGKRMWKAMLSPNCTRASRRASAMGLIY